MLKKAEKRNNNFKLVGKNEGFCKTEQYKREILKQRHMNG